MKVGVTGASGFIGKKVCKSLEENGHEVYKFVRREPKAENEIYWKPSKQEIDNEKFESLDAVIHLAGESIAPRDIFGFLPFSGGRWTKEKNQEYIGQENGHLIYLSMLLIRQKIILKYSFLLQGQLFMVTMVMR